MSIKERILLFICLVIYAQPCQASVYTIDNPLFKAQLGSASHFHIPENRLLFTIESIQFQFGPSFHTSTRLDDRNSFILGIEHLFWHQESWTEHNAQRVILINMYWKRIVNRKTAWGLGYVISPNKLYHTSKQFSVSEQVSATGLIGLGSFLTFEENKLLFSFHANFVNDSYFFRDAGLLYNLEILAQYEMFSPLSVSIKYWNRFNSSFYNENNKSAITPFIGIVWNNLAFEFGPVFSMSRFPSNFVDRFNMQGTLGIKFGTETGK